MTETHDLINKGEVIGKTEVELFKTLPDAVMELGEKKALQYINKMWKNVQVNKARAMKLKESGSGAEIGNMVKGKYAGLTSDSEREEVKAVLGLTDEEIERLR